jgi:hypothetical protein
MVMRAHFRTLWRHRPRILTSIAFLATAAIIVFANFTYDQGRVWRCIDVFFEHKSYGWPLIWHRYVGIMSDEHRGEIGWYFSPIRLAANAATWLVMLVASAGTCELLLHRYRPRLRWSLRTMLIAVGLAAAGCGWFANARQRAMLQDAMIASTSVRRAWVERWGPKWLDLVGADRYRRQINFVRLEVKAGDEEHLAILKRLKDFPNLRHVEMKVDHLTPDISKALAESLQLRNVSIEESEEPGGDERAWRESLATIAEMTQLEYLHMSEPAVRGESLARLSSLANLKSLRIDGFVGQGGQSTSHVALNAIRKVAQLEYLELHWMNIRANSLARLGDLNNLKLLSLEFVRAGEAPLFDSLPPLERLEAINIKESNVGDESLRRLVVLPRLRALGLDGTQVTPAGLAEFASLALIEELTLENELATADALRVLPAFTRLQTLHLGRNEYGPFTRWAHLPLDRENYVQVLKEELDRCRSALLALRQARPGIVIDSDSSAITSTWEQRSRPRFNDDVYPRRFFTWLPVGSMPRMTRSEFTSFTKSGGWANFSGAGFRDENGDVLTVLF